MNYKAALDADARLAAKNALKILAALRQTFDAKAVYQQYLSTQPNKSNNPAQDRARARAWAIMNVQPNMQAMNTVMQRVLAEGYVTGEAFADEQLRLARELKKADDTYVDWSNWQPGDRAAALLLRPPKAFQQLLQSQGIALKEMSETTTRDIGNAIADAVDLGMSAERSAKNIMRHVANPARALSIAITEQNRAISYATVNRYKEAGLEKMEWEVSSPCDKCARNANAVVPIGAPFPTGVTQPPQHPHCRCVLLPVIPDFDDPAATGGSVTTTPTPVSTGKWEKVDEQAWVDRQVARRAVDPRFTDPYNDIQLQILRDQAKDSDIFIRGPHILRVDRALANGPTPKEVEAFLDNFDQMYERLPAWRKFDENGLERGYNLIINNEAKGNTLAYTYLGHDTIWFSIKDVKSVLDDPKDWKGWFMSAANTSNENLYTIAHEMGHTVDSTMNAHRGRVSGALRRKYPELFSRYSGRNAKEAYAEVFAEWILGVRNPVTEGYAEKFGWNLSAEDYYSDLNRMVKWQPHHRTILLGD
jgi:SPP1 gp7 family putative phage head morphogenesis protein